MAKKKEIKITGGIQIQKDTDNDKFSMVDIPSPQLFKTVDSYLLSIKKQNLSAIEKEQGAEAQPTNQVDGGIVSALQVIEQPVDIIVARSLKDISPHHSSCIQAKKYSIMGLGFVSEGDDTQAVRDDKTTPVNQVQDQMSNLLTGEAYVKTKADEKLDPLTIHGFAFEMYRVIEDFLDSGTGYLEVVRKGNEITGLSWMPYEDVFAVIIRDDSGRNRLAYSYIGGLGATSPRYYSLFGLENKAWTHQQFYKDSTVEIDSISEIIPFMLPSNQSRYYGYPDWLSASAIVTLLSRALQYKSDFYTNKGVLAYIMTLIGQIDADVWKKIQEKIQGSVGGGNNFRNLAINLKNSESKVQIDKLASSDKTEDQFAKDAESFAQHIVSAHKVPPLLANVLIPGKMGAANETVQAIVLFQLLCVGPMQNIVQHVLANTLANGKDGVKGLSAEDIRLRKITSQINVQGLDTASRMREDATNAKNPDGSKRDVRDGLKD